MKKVFVVCAAIALFTMGCNKENQVKPIISPTVVDTAADVRFLTSGLLPTAMTPDDSMITITLAIRVEITPRDSDIYLPRSLPSNYDSLFTINQRGNTSVYSIQYLQQAQRGVTIHPTGNLRIDAHTSAIIAYFVVVKTHANRGEYQLKWNNIICSVGTDDGVFESSIPTGPEFITEWISTY